MTNDSPPDTSPAGTEIDTEIDTWSFEVRHQCAKCDRLAIVYDDHETPLCARHATIFITAVNTLRKPGGGADTP